MSKRKFEEADIEGVSEKQPLKNSLDSDEDDDEVNEDAYNVMNEDELEGIFEFVSMLLFIDDMYCIRSK